MLLKDHTQTHTPHSDNTVMGLGSVMRGVAGNRVKLGGGNIIR
jgi:hypothetical protein